MEFRKCYVCDGNLDDPVTMLRLTRGGYIIDGYPLCFRCEVTIGSEVGALLRKKRIEKLGKGSVYPQIHIPICLLNRNNLTRFDIERNRVRVWRSY